MTHPKHPPRLVDPASGTPEAVRAILRAGRGELPDAEQLARLAARLPLGSPQAPGPAGPTPAAPVNAVGSSLIPSALTGAALAVAVVIGVAWRGGDLGPTTAPPSIAVSAAAPRASAPAEPERPRAEAKPARIDPPVGSATPVPAVTMGGDPPNPPAQPAAAAAPPAVPTASGAPVTGDEPRSLPIEDESEVHLLQRAQDALGADPGRALALATEHARRFPGGALAQERELIAVAALVGTGRTADARARGERFLEAFPRSAHRRRIEALIGVSSLQKNEPGAPPTP